MLEAFSHCVVGVGLVTTGPQPDRASALRAERIEVLRFCSSLSGEEWQTPSAASGWRVQDVVAHLGAGCHSLFTPAAMTMLLSKDIERTNDAMVRSRRSWEPQTILDEFARWSARFTKLASVTAATPVNNLRLPLAELGSFPLGLLLGGAMVFDQHTHLRFDIAPAIDRVAPTTDANRMSVVIEWMLAVLANQLRKSPPEWMDRPVSLTLTGPGGGQWSIATTGIATGIATVGKRLDLNAAHVVASAEQFPEWATQRAAWRDRDVTLSGDSQYGERFLDGVNVV